MKILKGIANFFGILAALVLSLVLICVLIAAPMLSALSTFTHEDTVKDIVQDVVQEVVDNIDVEEIIFSNEELSQVMQESGITSDVVKDILDSETVQDVIDLYIEDVYNALDGGTEQNLTTDAVMDIVEENIEELTPIVSQIVGAAQGEEAEITEEEALTQIEAIVNEYGQDLLDMLPNIQDLLGGNSTGDETAFVPARRGPTTMMAAMTPSVPDFEEMTEQELIALLMEVAQALRSGVVMNAMITCIVVLSVLILIFRWVRLKGLVWLTVDFGIAAGLSYGLANSIVPAVALVPEIAQYQSIIQPVLDVLVLELTNVAQIEAIVAVVCLVLKILVNLVWKKKKPASAVAAPVVETAPAVEEAAPAAAEEAAPAVEEEPVPAEETVSTETEATPVQE